MKRNMRIRLFDKDIILVVIIFMSFFVFAGNAEAVLTDNLVSYWSFDSDSTDGWGTNDLNAGGASHITSNCKLGGGCYDFVASESDIMNTGTVLSTTGPYTISFWSSWDICSYALAAGQWIGGISEGLYITPGGRNVHFSCTNRLEAQWSQQGESAVVYTPSPNTWAAQTWKHIAFTFSSTTGAKLYDNGVLVLNSTTDVIDYENRAMGIGGCTGELCSTTKLYNYFDGQLDEIGYWTRNLSALEISALYNGGTGYNPGVCGAGQYNGGSGCINVGAGYYSPAGNAHRYQCAAGYYGSSTTNSVSTCNGACGAGKYCPTGSSSTTNCLAGFYGSSTTNSVATCNGACLAGYYGGTTGLTVSTCSGQCTAGYYCTAGSTSATQNVCGAGNYCIIGSSGPIYCAAGYYGTSTTNSVSTCNGQCTAGYYCIAGSTSATQFACGAGKYCPTGSGSATNCAAGYYGTSTTNSVSTCNGACTAGY
ncbi:LamG domain-containing protein, partial [Candidatus Woesearchaeota archaeon]|nr:LamG domain-containing protein [Candidatus Woesearchaeota archaeon]